MASQGEPDIGPGETTGGRTFRKTSAVHGSDAV